MRPELVDAVFIGSSSASGLVIAGTLHFFSGQHTGNVIGTVALHGHPKDAPHHGGGLIVNQPMVLILRVFDIPVDRGIGRGLPGIALYTVSRCHLAGLVPQIPFVDDIEERGELTAVLILGIYIVGDGNEADAVLPEEYLRIKAGLQIITTDTAHVLHQDSRNLAGLNICDQPLPVRAFKITTAPTVVRIMDDVAIPMLCRIGFEVAFLIYDGTGIPREVVIAGKTLVQRRDLFLSLLCAHDALLSD